MIYLVYLFNMVTFSIAIVSSPARKNLRSVSVNYQPQSCSIEGPRRLVGPSNLGRNCQSFWEKIVRISCKRCRVMSLVTPRSQSSSAEKTLVLFLKKIYCSLVQTPHSFSLILWHQNDFIDSYIYIILYL